MISYAQTMPVLAWASFGQEHIHVKEKHDAL